MRFGKSYICSNKLDVQETNLSFAQFNRIRNHLLRRRIKVGRDSRSRFMGLIVLVLGNTNQDHDRTPVVCRDKNHVRQQSRGVINVLDNVDLVSSNVPFSHQEALLYVFEDNEAVIKMIIKGRSPTMRHVSRTHRVALDWSFDRINLDPRSKSKLLTPKTNSQTC